MGPFHSQNYKLSVRGAVHGPVVAELGSEGGGNRLATTYSYAWATLFNSSSKGINSTKMSTFGDLQKKRGKLPKLLYLFLFFSFAFCISLAYFLVFVLCVRSQILFCRSLNELP